MREFFQNSNLNFAAKSGIFLVWLSLAVMAYTSNFPWKGRYEKKRMQELQNKIASEKISRTEKQEHQYYLINDAIQKISIVLFALGTFVFLIGFITSL